MATTSFFNPIHPPHRFPLTALVSLVATLGIAGCGSSGAPSSGEPDASVSTPGANPAPLKSSEAALRTVQALRTQFKLTPPQSPAHRLSLARRARPSLLLAHASASKPRALLTPSPARSYELTGTWLRPVFSKEIRAGVLKPAKVRLGSTATEVAGVQDESSGAAMTVQWLDARDSISGSFAKGYVVYDGVKGPGTTALTRADIRGAEQYVKVTTEGHGELHYRVNLDDKIAGLRQVKGTQALEFLDKKGAPRLRMTAPVALAGTEKVALKLRVVDCAIDTSPRAPWGRAVTDPGRSACEVVVSWDGAQGHDLLVDPAWTTTGSMAQARRWHTASVLKNGKVLVAGGMTDVECSDTAELYDPTSGTWATTGSMTLGRRGHMASKLNDGKVLVAGGLGKVNDEWTDLTSAELYDPISGTWTTTGSMAQGRQRPTASVLNGGKVLVAGGGTRTGSRLSSAELYDPSSGTWVITGSMAQARLRPTASVLTSGKVLVAGGETSTGSHLSSAELYEPSSGTWTTTGSMAQGRVVHTASVLPSGKVLVANGSDVHGNLTSAELYDPTSGTWATTGSMAQGRVVHTASVLPSGKVLVAGGFAPLNGNWTSLSSAELYEPSSGTWATTGSMAQGRGDHTASVLPSGKVLVAGGWAEVNGNWTNLSSAELFASEANGGSCTWNGECASNHCVDSVCCDKSCSTAGYRCIQIWTGKPDGTCAPVPNGHPCSSETECGSGHCIDGVCCDKSCSASGDRCVQTWTEKLDGICAPVPNGHPCSSETECGSGHCIDGVCCNTTCNTPCMACVQSKTGTSNGTCSPISAGTDPDDECSPVGVGECQTPGVCNGSGACKTKKGELCGSGTPTCMTVAIQLKSLHCDATGQCLSDNQVECSPYKCKGNACLEACSTSADCLSPSVCMGGECKSALSDGTKCSENGACASGHCVDGVCCDKPCNGQCESCDGSKTVSGTAGVCSPVVAGADPDNECAKDNSNVCGTTGTCDGQGQCAKANSDKECGTVCDGNTTVTRRCNGVGTCEAVASTAKPCTPYGCSTVTGTCRSVCTADTDCAPGYGCTESKCVKSASGTGGSATGGDATGEAEVKQDNGCGCSVPGGNPGKNKPWAALGLALAALGLARRRR